MKENERIGSESHFDGFYWGKDIEEWIVDSVEDSDVFNELADGLIDLLVERVKDKDLISKSDCVNYLLAFVHQFRYSLDKRSTGIREYARFPLETLYDKTGDCECLAILLAALIHSTNIAPVAIIRVYKSHFFAEDDRHIAVGVSESADGSMQGTYIEHEGEKYFYCEATGERWRAGEVPNDFHGASFRVYPVD